MQLGFFSGMSQRSVRKTRKEREWMEKVRGKDAERREIQGTHTWLSRVG